MTTGAPLPVREYASAEENRAHAREVRARLFGAPRVPSKRPEPIVRPGRVAFDSAVLWPEAAPEPVPARTPAEVKAAYLDAMRAMAPGDHSLRSVIRVVAMVTGFDTADLCGRSRRAPVVKARQIAMYLGRTLLARSYLQLGAALGGRDHSTAIFAHHRVSRVVAACALAPSDDVVAMAERLWAAPWPDTPAPSGDAQAEAVS